MKLLRDCSTYIKNKDNLQCILKLKLNYWQAKM